MAKYTIELNTLLKDEKFKLFDFDYDFYNVDFKSQFEQRFIDTYLFNEIGFETVARFKHYLKSKLNNIMPYYIKLYETEIASKDINFLLNKDLKETTERNLNEVGQNTSSSSTNETSSSNNETSTTETSTSNNNSTTNATSNSNSKESYLDNGNADINLTEGSLTGVSGNESTGNSTSTNNTENSLNNSSTNNTTNNQESSLSSNSNSTNQQTEKLTYISQGNIGITSSAELLQKWRDVIIDIDRMIIEECQDLFIQIY